MATDKFLERIPPEKQKAGCLISLPVVPIVVSLALVARRFTKGGSS